MHAFITGATGFLGKHVTQQLINQGWKVTALCRDRSKLTHYPVPGIDWVQGKLQNIQSIRRAMPEKVDAVFHLAGDTTTWSLQHRRQYTTNVLGTQNVAKVALEKRAIRFIHTSSIAVYGFHEDSVDEHSEMRGIDSPIAYFRSKYLAEEVIREHIKKGLDAVILNPAVILGPHDQNNWIQLFQKTKQDALPSTPPGKRSFCFAEDVAKAHIQAFVHGRCGENYILSGPSADLLQVCQWIARRLGKPIPTHTMPAWLLKLTGFFSSILSHLTRKEPTISFEKAQIICASIEASSEKAHRELQYRNSKTIEEMLEATYQWWIHQQAGDLLNLKNQDAA